LPVDVGLEERADVFENIRLERVRIVHDDDRAAVERHERSEKLVEDPGEVLNAGSRDALALDDIEIVEHTCQEVVETGNRGLEEGADRASFEPARHRSTER
jgi:hypothetical protein